jgi:hypothetical protein
VVNYPIVMILLVWGFITNGMGWAIGVMCIIGVFWVAHGRACLLHIGQISFSSSRSAHLRSSCVSMCPYSLSIQVSSNPLCVISRQIASWRLGHVFSSSQR